MSRIYPSVGRLQLHLPNMQQVQYYSQQNISDVLNNACNSRTMLTEFFRVYAEDGENMKYFYSELPRHYRWLASERTWQTRKASQPVIGWLYASSPSEGERFYLRALLNHVRGPKSFDDLMTVNGSRYLTFKQAAEKLGILEEDDSIQHCLIEDELTISISTDDLRAKDKLNSRQLVAFNTIKHAIERKESAVFCVDGPGGTGKTFLYRAILAYFRSKGFIMLATATSGIAATQLPAGRTAHSKLKIPIKLDSNSRCSLSKQSEMCQLFQRASAIIWDEAPMANRKAIETVDVTLREMLGVDLPFGGLVMILGGDFRHMVPVVVGGTRTQAIHASVVESYLWSSVKLLRLTNNIRAHEDPSFADFLIRVGNGEEPTIQDDMVRISDSMVIPWEGETSIDQLISSTFPMLGILHHDGDYMMHRAIITPRNDEVHELNEKIIARFQAEDEITYYSFDSVEEEMRNLFMPEFLNSLSPGNLPPHKLTLKKGCPIMLLRNIDPRIGLCNGTRLLCHRFARNVIDAEVLTGEYKGTRVFLPRIPLKTSEDANFPFEMTCRQFPVRLAFALTINKSQGQTIPHVGIYLPDHVFSHGQLYVALSRGVSQEKTKVLVKNGKIHGYRGTYTKNVVFPKIFRKLQLNSI